ncbi:sensor histidine kinase [Salinibacter altiplanensis]|uniref:sensor histidine kinase n=1 Tax=Salinibacter altiplanensis TaxID=1803181 RepID=UPI000C9F6286|nr:sensor histidine kinase [Salinibacter altiplanensis]
MTHKCIKITFFLFSVVHLASAQPAGLDERGVPFPSEHYAPPEYGHSSQNWDVVEDDRGLMYFANSDGVLQYDGQRWRLIPTASGEFVRSLAADSLVYVGEKGDFGYLEPDSVGVLRYTSLYDRIPKDERNFEDIWSTHVVEDVVYYQSNQRLFRWDGSTVTSWSSDGGFHTSFVVDGTLYVREKGKGLLRMEGDSLSLVPGGEIFHGTPIYMIAPHPSGDLLVGTQNKGLLRYDGEEFRSFAPGVTAYLQENDFYHGRSLPKDRYALATIGGGVVLIDSQGHVDRVLDRASGLPDNVVNHLHVDRGGQLWMALNNEGIFRADLNSSLTVHDRRTGLNSTVKSIEQHEDTTYVSTEAGLYVLRDGQGNLLGQSASRFEQWGDGNLPVVWDMTSVGEDLLLATDRNAVYRIRGGNKKEIGDWVFTYSLLRLDNKDIVYAATRSGLKGLSRDRDEWSTFSVGGFQEEIRTISIPEEGVLWAATTGGEVFRIRLSPDGRQAESVVRYDHRDGLPRSASGAQRIGGRVTIISEEGFYQIENPGQQSPESWRFVCEQIVPPEINGTDTLKVQSVTNGKNSLWVVAENQVFFGRADADSSQESSAYRWKSVKALHFPKPDVTRASVNPNGTLWLSHGSDLFRYDWDEGSGGPPLTPPPSPIVRRVSLLESGRTVHGGAGPVSGDGPALVLSHGRDVQVEVAVPQYSTVEPHQYRYKLAGDAWSDWTTDASQRYRGLWEGTYQLKVQARNDRGQVSEASTFSIQILPPWYRTPWAYLAYGLGFIGLAYGYRRYRLVKRERRQARKRVRELERERVVAERLKKANERLREANRLKEDFLATTSHELRTPLTNILGSLEVLRDLMEGEETEFLDMIEKNGQRLKRTLNALLDLSMLRAGEEDLGLTPMPIDECVARVASDLRTDAEEKGLSFRVDTSGPPAWADLDEQYLEQILRNLIENAIKYTEEGVVAVSTGAAEDRVYVEVEDTGIGIDEAFLPDLFEEFKQESRGRSRTFEGNGLGLAISARLADQMDGAIRVETEKKKGSRFRVEFPRSSAPVEAGAEG